jgi:alpha-tubulin suppressor-like RCC1 family protein
VRSDSFQGLLQLSESNQVEHQLTSAIIKMIPPKRSVLISFPGTARTFKGPALHKRCFRGAGSSQAGAASRPLPRGRKAAFLVSATVGAGLLYLTYPSHVHAEAVPARADAKFEEAQKRTSSNGENRGPISSQQLQLKNACDNPGVYVWGSNAGRVVATDSDEPNIKKPRRIPYFDGKIIRDIKLDINCGAAITENGDLIQWGTGFSSSSPGPTPTLSGKDLVKLAISRDRVVALSSNGTVYSVPASQAHNEPGFKRQEHSWFPFCKSKSLTSYRTLTPSNLEWGEKVSDISSSLEHCLILTSSGRVFSAASATEDFPSKGQLGVSGLSWANRPPGPFDQPHEITTLKGFKISKIATGNYHSLVLDAEGRIFSFGDNSSGQLGVDFIPSSPIIDTPTILPVDKLYKGSNLSPRVTDIAAGGSSTFFTVDATRVPAQTEDDPRGLSRITADTWACGRGILGALGNGRWTHMQDTPTKVKALSGLCEYDDIKNMVVPIRLSRLSVGSTHVSAVMGNGTYLGTSSRVFKDNTPQGADVLLWGGNEFYQLGSGKRNNVNSPAYIPPLDIETGEGRGEEDRFQLTPRKKIRVGRRNVSVEQRIECGRGITAVYSGT